jgi:hypothetical protein
MVMPAWSRAAFISSTACLVFSATVSRRREHVYGKNDIAVLAAGVQVAQHIVRHVLTNGTIHSATTVVRKAIVRCESTGKAGLCRRTRRLVGYREDRIGEPALEFRVVTELFEQLGIVLHKADQYPAQCLVMLDPRILLV